MDSEILETVADVFAALDGNSGVVAITGCKPNTVAMWKMAGCFPSNTYRVLDAALKARGRTASPSLWPKMIPTKEEIQ